jgi:hypothetical protein
VFFSPPLQVFQQNNTPFRRCGCSNAVVRVSVIAGVPIKQHAMVGVPIAIGILHRPYKQKIISCTNMISALQVFQIKKSGLF